MGKRSLSKEKTATRVRGGWGNRLDELTFGIGIFDRDPRGRVPEGILGVRLWIPDDVHAHLVALFHGLDIWFETGRGRRDELVGVVGLVNPLETVVGVRDVPVHQNVFVDEWPRNQRDVHESDIDVTVGGWRAS